MIAIAPLLLARFMGEGAERVGEGDLFFVGQVDLRKDDDPAPLHQLADFLRPRSGKQGFLVGVDHAADFRRGIGDFP